jgi:iron complex outermembrane receptor protein
MENKIGRPPVEKVIARSRPITPGPQRRSTLVRRSVAAFFASLVLCTGSAAYSADDSSKHFEIKAEPLADALLEFGVQSGLTILAPTTLTAGKKAAAVRGDFVPTDALGRLIKGSGLTFARAADGTIAIQAITSNTPVQASAVESGSDKDSTLEAVVVTGSRISGFTAPTPTTIVGAADMQSVGAPNVADALNRLPEFNGVGPTSQGISTSAIGANYLNLRNLGQSRTLVFVDGERYTPTSSAGTLDINVLPSALVKRVDVVTGGASAAYGSDAVAGVVNIILDHDINGIRGSIQSGITQYGDDKTLNGTLAAGTEVLGGKGHVEFAAEVSSTWNVPYYGSRPWAKNYQLLTSTMPGAGVTSPSQFVVPNVQYATQTLGGVITSGPLRGTNFLPGGLTAPLQYGTNVGNFMQGGGGDSLTQDVILDVPQTRSNFFGAFDYNFSSALRLSVTATHADSKALATTTPPTEASLTIQSTNAFLPQAIRNQLQSLKIPSFTMGRLDLDFGLIGDGARTITDRASVSLDGDLGGSWTYDGHVEYGRSSYFLYEPNDLKLTPFFDAINAVTAPAGIVGIVPGSIVCRSTLTNPTDGCIPINIFGNGSPNNNPAAMAALKGTAWYKTNIYQGSATVNLHGEPFQLPAGPVSVAFGGEYRRDTLTQVADPLSLVSGWRIGNFQPLSGAYDVKEIYGETRIPMLTDVPFAKSLSVNAAGRFTSYSISGNVETWKVGGIYAVDNNVLIRGTVSRDIRAPNLGEFFQAGTQSSAGITDRLNNNLQYTAANFSGGNPNLQPERALTATYGVVFTPQFMSGLRFSADYYAISIGQTIGTFSSQQVIDLCWRGSANFCGNIIRSPATGLITRINTVYQNLGERNQTGVDLEADYTWSANDLIASWPGVFNLRLLANYVGKDTSFNGFSTTNGAGQVGTPKWKGDARLSYSEGHLLLYVEERFVGAQVYDNSYTSLIIADNNVGGAAYTTMSVSYDISNSDQNKLQAFLVVDNLFNSSPSIVAGTAFAAQTRPGVFDTLGRRFTAGIRFAF